MNPVHHNSYNDIEFLIRELKATYPVSVHNHYNSDEVIDIGIEEHYTSGDKY